MKVWKKIARIYDWAEMNFEIFTFFLIIILVFVQVICRYVLQASLTWSEELVRYMYLWDCWLGVSLAQRTDQHIKLVFLLEKMPVIVQKVFSYIAEILSIAIALALAIYGFQMVMLSAGTHVVSPALGVPMSIYYLCMPVGCCVYIIRLVAQRIRIIKNKGTSLEEIAQKEVSDLD